MTEKSTVPQPTIWLTPEAILHADNLRSPLVAESVRLWQQPARYPLSLVSAFNWPAARGA